MAPQRIIWHHSADPTTEHQFNKINEYHRQRDFPVSSLGFYVGYHWLIEYDGTLKQARKETEIGAHDTGENLNSIGICLAGDFGKSLPSEAQAATAALLVSQIRAKWNIPLTRFEPHRIDDDTSCPGFRLPDNWLIKQYLERHSDPLHRLFWWLGERLKLL